MKRFFILIVAVCAFLAASAQHPMVTLSRNGELKFFSNLTALNAAVDSAQNGDVLYLSEGEFVISGGAMTITKRLSIVGNGYGSHILGNVTIDMSSNKNSYMDAPLFDGVRLDKLIFWYGVGSGGNDSRDNLIQSEIRRCWIWALAYAGAAGKEVTFDKCYIEYGNFLGGGSVLVKNSKVRGGYSASTTYPGDYTNSITAINSHIYNPDNYPLNTIASIIHNSNESQPKVSGSSCTISNSLLDFTPSDSKVHTYECYTYSDDSQPLLDENLDCPLNLTELGYLGSDGTVVGIYGGEDPFSENPSVPTVDTANSSVEYDAEGNKLKVSITVKAD